MTHSPAPDASGDSIEIAARLLLSALDQLDVGNEARMQELDQLTREASTYLHRKAAYHARDRACYRIGSALEPNGGHELDDVALAGLDHLGAFGLLLILPVALINPGESLSGLLRLLFASEVGRQIREWGVWSRLTWLRALYLQETVSFLLSKKGMDPAQRWRKEKPTERQKYLAREISRALNIEEPSFDLRGEAFEWLKEQGGNPRFRGPPPIPPLPVLPPEIAA